MATVGRTNGASFSNTPRLSFISTAAFNTFFYSYSTSINSSLETIGTLAAVTGATAGNCPAGRVLRENGRKLYPGANPGITTYMVGVYDAQTMLSGFIDPNAQVFQIYNTDKPTFLLDGVEPTLGTTDQGPSLYTRGDITAQGAGTINSGLTVFGGETINGGSTINGGQTVNGGETVNNGFTANGGSTLNGGTTINGFTRFATTTTLTQSGATALTINCLFGNYFVVTITGNTNFTINATNIASGQPIYVIYNNPSSFTPTVTMGSGIREYYNAGAVPVTFSGNLSITQHFIGNGTDLCEVARMFITGI